MDGIIFFSNRIFSKEALTLVKSFLVLLVIVGHSSGGSPNDPDSLVIQKLSSSHIARDIAFEKLFFQALPFADAAKAAGIVIEQNEIERRVALYSMAHPNRRLSPDKAEKILLAEKYADQLGYRVSDVEFENHLKTRTRLLEGGRAEKMERLRESAKFEILFSKPEVMYKGKEMDLVEFLKSAPKREAALTNWPQSNLQIAGRVDECFLWLDSLCFITLGEYNSAASHARVPQAIPLDSAKSTVLKKYFFEKRLAGKSKALGFGHKDDLIRTNYQKNRQTLYWIEKSRRFGKPVVDPRGLRTAYNKHYQQYFRARFDITWNFICSSDSVYIDSIHGLLGPWKQSKQINPTVTSGIDRELHLPWASTKEESLPPSLVLPNEKFHLGQITAPIKTDIGFFILKLSKIISVKEKTFDESYGKLVYLATRDFFFSIDSLREALARNYYQKNISQFAIPDTIDLKSWLVPQSYGKTSSPTNTKLNADLKSNVLSYRPIRVSSLLLPSDMISILQNALQRDTSADLFGPYQLNYGVWYFKAMSRKKSVDTVPFSVVKREILRMLVTSEEDEPIWQGNTQIEDDVALNLGLANHYISTAFENLSSLSISEIEERVTKGEINETELPSLEELDQRLAAAKAQLQRSFLAQNREESNSVFKKAKINSKRLFGFPN